MFLVTYFIIFSSLWLGKFGVVFDKFLICITYLVYITLLDCFPSEIYICLGHRVMAFPHVTHYLLDCILHYRVVLKLAYRLVKTVLNDFSLKKVVDVFPIVANWKLFERAFEITNRVVFSSYTMKLKFLFKIMLAQVNYWVFFKRSIVAEGDDRLAILMNYHIQLH